MTRSIRSRLSTVVLLGVVTAALSLTALYRAISISNSQRIERAHETVTQELDALLSARASSPIAELPAPPDMTVVNMHGGYWTLGQEPSGVPEGWHATLADALRDSASAGQRVIREHSIANATVVASAAPIVGSRDRFAWAALVVRPPIYLRSWKQIVVALTIAAALLVTTALLAVVTVKRSASALNSTLASLARDLSTPIPRPTIRELGEVADGIERLAKSLAQSRSAEERLSAELAQRERLAALGRVVAGVAHEIRNPLASIKLRLDLASASAALPPAVTSALTNATAEIERLDRLVADLLVVAGRQIGPKRPTELSSLVRSRAEALAPWSAERRVQIRVQGDASAEVDPDSLTRAIDNLLRNAVEASPEGNAVDVAIERVAGEVRIRFEDRGAGIAPERTAELFEPFFTTKSGGTGLGLAISRSIARAHGGEVMYARRDGSTSFELTLRAAAPSATREAAA
jgi:signal transduction histidine kinase